MHQLERRVAKLEPRPVGDEAASTGAKERLWARISAMAERRRASGAPLPTDAEQQQTLERVTEFLRGLASRHPRPEFFHANSKSRL